MKTLTSIGLALAMSAFSMSSLAASRVNAIHLAPFASTLPGTAVSINVNGTEVATGVQFNQATGYINGPVGSTTVDVYAPPGSASPAITATANLADNTDYTVAAIGDGSNQPLALLPLTDDNTAPATGNVKLRVVHAAPFAAALADTAVSVRTNTGTVVNGLSNVQYGASSGYFEVPAGTYDLEVDTPDGSTKLINPAPVNLPAGTIVTLFARGDGVNQPLGVTAVFGDGSTQSLPLESTAPPSASSPVPSLGMLGLLALVLGVLAAALAYCKRHNAA